jgi:DNA-binding transcriptional ArsR family regulator
MTKLTEAFDANGDESGTNKPTLSHHGPFDDWLALAGRLPGKSLHLATMLQSLARAQNTRQVELSNLVCQEFGLTRNAKYRALGWLEEANLVRVARKLGRSPLVKILDGSDAT